jgi:hypothetical protein
VRTRVQHHGTLLALLHALRAPITVPLPYCTCVCVELRRRRPRAGHLQDTIDDYYVQLMIVSDLVSSPWMCTSMIADTWLDPAVHAVHG